MLTLNRCGTATRKRNSGINRSTSAHSWEFHSRKTVFPFSSGHIDSAGKCISQGISAERKRGACCSVGALRKHHRPIAREQFLTVLASGKLETKVLVDCVSGEGQFPGFLVCRWCLLVVYSFVGRTKESLGFNYKDCNPIQKFYFSIPGY